MTAAAKRLVESSWFDPLMLGVIAINAVVLGLETYDDIERGHGPSLDLTNNVILGVFVVELLIRMAATGFRPKAYFSSGWNVFDFIVVTSSFVPGVRENATLLRLARLLRITRAVRLLPDLRVLTVAVARSIPGVASLAVITVLLVYVYGMVGWLIFDDFAPAGGDYAHIGQAMVTMFVMLSLENLPDNLAMGQELSQWTLLFFISYVLVASFLIFNLFIGIVINSMEDARQEETARRNRASGHGDLGARLSALQAELAQIAHEYRAPPPERYGGAGKPDGPAP
jgi:voltage-gated sodium channel